MRLFSWIHDLSAFLQYGDLPTRYYMKRGMKVGRNFNRQSGTRLDPNNCWLIEIGDDVIMSNKVQILAHDFSTMHSTGYVRFGRVKIGDRVFIGANSTIMMNVHIGDDAIIGSGSLVNKDVPAGMVVAGVPAKVICTVEEYQKKQMQMIEDCPRYDRSETTYAGKMSKEKQNVILAAIDNNPHRVFYAKFRPFIREIGTGKLIKVHSYEK